MAELPYHCHKTVGTFIMLVVKVSFLYLPWDTSDSIVIKNLVVYVLKMGMRKYY